MKYVCFYDDGKYYYCYSDEGKIYKGVDAKNSTTTLQYFVYIMITNFVAALLNDFFKDKLDNTLSLIIISFGVIVSVLLGVTTYKKIITEADKKLRETYLSDEQLKEYIVRGKKRFSIEVLLLYIMIMFSIGSFMFFYFERTSFFWIFGVLFGYISMLLYPWIAPFKKYRFYKKHLKR